MSRIKFAARFALTHLLISILVAGLSSWVVFGVWYPTPYRDILRVIPIFLVILVADVICGPCLTLILASPRKSRRERWLDFSLIAVIQVAALAYGIYSVWEARPVILAFERDRLVIVTANEIDLKMLKDAPPALQHLPYFGLMKVGTRQPIDNDEFFKSVELGLAGVSPAMRPNWWVPWEENLAQIKRRSKPLLDLIARRPEAEGLLRRAAQKTGIDVSHLSYLPLTSGRAKEWIALLDADSNLVGYAPVDGF